MQDPRDCLAIAGANRCVEEHGKGVGVDPFLEFCPVRKPVFTRDDQLGIAQTELPRRQIGRRGILESWVPPADTIKRRGNSLAKLL